jgi:acetyl esterase/lipase
MTVRQVFIAGLIAGAPSCLHAQVPPTPPQPLTVEGASTYVYKTIDTVQLRLHVFLPKAPISSPRPAMLFFFGGGWVNGNVTQFVPQATHLAELGVAGILVDYRVKYRHNTSPFEAMADAKSAVRWVRAHASSLGIDPGRVAASGGSAGGHVALSAGIFDRFDEPTEDQSISSKPDLLVLFNPAVDATTPAWDARFNGRGREGSPLYHRFDSLPPTLILHGKDDRTVPYAGVEKLCGDARARGLPCELIGYDGAGHGFFNPHIEEGKWYRETVSVMDAFLARHGYLAARP